MSFSLNYIMQVLEFLGHIAAGGVIEVRIFPKDRYITIGNRRVYVGSVISGYYNDYKKLVRDIKPFDGKANIYVTINPCIEDLYARSANRLQYGAKVTTTDREILQDTWFPIDIDPVRPAGISSTDQELKIALEKRDEVADFLSPWATVVKGMSGNGGHGLIRLTGYPTTKKHAEPRKGLPGFFQRSSEIQE